jgi:hypothetical protein
VFMFAIAEDADTFCKEFGGERMHRDEMRMPRKMKFPKRNDRPRMFSGHSWMKELLMGSKEPPKKRRRPTAAELLQQPSLQARVARRAKDLQAQADRTAPGPERNALLLSIRDMRKSDELLGWLSSPELQPPK